VTHSQAASQEMSPLSSSRIGTQTSWVCAIVLLSDNMSVQRTYQLAHFNSYADELVLRAPGVNGTYTLAPPPLGTSPNAGNQQRGGQGKPALASYPAGNTKNLTLSLTGGVVTPTTTIALGPSTPVPAPGPTQTGVSPLCNAWQTPAQGLGCVDFATLNGISSSQLYTWNPVLGPSGENCATQFWFQEYYCVGVVQGNGSVVMTTSPTTSR
jgi:hypothetical protein